MITIKSPMISNIMLIFFNVSIYSPLIFFIYIISIYNSITNLIKVQYIESGAKSINNGSNISLSHTVTACPRGYSWIWVRKESFRATQTDVNLKGTTLSYKLYNHSGSNSTYCYVRGWLVFYPSNWNI